MYPPPPPPPVLTSSGYQADYVPPQDVPPPRPLACPPPTGQIPPLPPRPVPVVVAAAPVARRINVRQKGQRGEREIIDLLQIVVNTTRAKYKLAPVLLQRNTLQAHVGGCDVHGLAGFSIEVKFQECDFNPAWWRQCLKQAGPTNVPILFWRGSRQPWKVVMRVFVNTPKDRDQIQMDVAISYGEFNEWFLEAYDEACVNELQAVGH